eukprot:221340-Amphidinium_carterae.2
MEVLLEGILLGIHYTDFWRRRHIRCRASIAGYGDALGDSNEPPITCRQWQNPQMPQSLGQE